MPLESLPERKPSEEEAQEAIRTLLRWIGEDPSREGLQDTPARVLRAWRNDWGRGYQPEPPNLIRMFGDVVKNQEMVLVKNIAFYSTCEHHLAPFYGRAHVAYLTDPHKGVVGLSKLARVVDHYSRRLQTQERLTMEIADRIFQDISDYGCAVLMEAAHMCMISRGVNQPDAQTVTSALRGAFFKLPALRAEFLNLVSK